MIWTKLTNGIECNFSDGVYLQMRNLIRISYGFGASVVSVRYNAIDRTIDYDLYGVQNTPLYIDVSDYMRIVGVGGAGTLNLIFGASQYDIPFNVKGNINPNDLIVPRYPISSEKLRAQDATPILPPSVMLQSVYGITGSYLVYHKTGMLTLYSGQSSQTKTSEGIYSIDVPADTPYIEFYNASFGVGKRWNIQPLKCGRTYAMVQWMSELGKTKCATWEVREVKSSATNVQELQTIFDGYKVRKDIARELVLRLENLTSYDLWYYSDIITSSDVRVCLSEEDALFGEETMVEVATNSIVQPLNNELYNLEVTIKYRQYDCAD
jgi:hypothetical protein